MDAQEARKIVNKVYDEGTDRIRLISEKHLTKIFKKIEKKAKQGKTYLIIGFFPFFCREQTAKFCYSFCVKRLNAAGFKLEKAWSGDFGSQRKVSISWKE